MIEQGLLDDTAALPAIEAADDDEVHASETVSVGSESFSDEAFYPISSHSPSNPLLSNRHPQSRIRHPVGYGEHREQTIRRAFWLVKDPLELCATGQPRSTSERTDRVGRGCHTRLRHSGARALEPGGP